MRFKQFNYLHWAIDEMQGATHELCMSGVSAPPDGFVSQDSGDVATGEESHALTDAIAARYGVPADHCLPSLGASGGVFLSVTALITLARDAGDEAPLVAIERPAYPAFEVAARLAGARIASLDRRPEDSYAIDVARVEDAISAGARIVCLTDLYNPVPVPFTDADVEGLHALAVRTRTWILVDEVYRDFLPEPVATAYRPDGRLIVTSSLTKCYGWGPARAGWVFAPPAVLARAEHVREIAHGVDPLPSLRAALVGVRNADSLRERGRQIADRARPVMDAWVESEERASWVPPAAGITGLVDVAGCKDSLELARRLRADLDVQVVPGHFFDAEGALRISFGLPPAQLSRALETLSLGLGALT